MPRIQYCLLIAGFISSGPLLADEIVVESVLLRLIDDVRVPATKAGVLSDVQVGEGQAVRAGSVLVNIDDFESDLLLKRSELELALAKLQIKNDVTIELAETELAFAKREYDRLTKAASTLVGSVSQSEVASVELAYRKARIAVADAKSAMDLARANQRIKENDVASMRRRAEIRQIVAPIDGTVEHVSHKAGEWVEPGTEIVRIISRKRIRAEGFVSSTHLRQNIANANVKLTVENKAFSNREFNGKIVFVHSEVDPVNRRMRVWAEIDNVNDRLVPGMRATMVIYPESRATNSK